MKTLVLNAGYEPVRIVSWQKAMILLLSEKAELVKAYDSIVRSAKRTYSCPQIIKLKRYIKSFAALAGTLSYSRQNVFRRDKYHCQYCNKKMTDKLATIDHVIPRSKGGLDTWENTVCACITCNSRKGNRTPEESQMSLIRHPKRPNMSHALRELLDEFDCQEWSLAET
ncbi:MAG: HNH endonuclease [Proteobacteria bacterium]|nr:HNH endonuclease [Pseudomonadota bacterium]